MSRLRIVAAGSFTTLLVGSALLPASAHADAPAAAPPTSTVTSPAATASAGTSRITRAARREIERVVDSGPDVRLRPARMRPAALARTAVRCAQFEGQRYCLHTGWTTRSEDAVVADVAKAAIAARRTDRETTGDLDPMLAMRQRAALPPKARARAERAELRNAAQAVAKVWLLRHQVQGVPLPNGFLSRHPEVDAAPNALARTTARKTARDYPRSRRVLRPKQTREQRRTYWCGPAAMQTIAWGWQDKRRTQNHWARRLGTTRNGSAITQLVRVTNEATGYDRKSYAGPYITLDISDWGYGDWWLLQMRHYADYRAPIILHPVLLKRYYPYLDDDASGHFQVGRGYDKDGPRPRKLLYFEPWNQQRFDPSEPYIKRSQRRNAYRSYRANKAHFQQNIGV